MSIRRGHDEMKLPIPPDDDSDYTVEIARDIIKMHFDVNLKLIEHLRKYGNHLSRCEVNYTPGSTRCDCGWKQIKKDLSL